MRPYGYGAKSRWGLPRVHLGANGVPWGPKNAKSRWGPPRVNLGAIGSKKWVEAVKNYHAPKFEFSTTPRSSISAKMRPYGYGAKSRWGLPRFHLGANGVPWGPKNAKSRWGPPRVHLGANGVPLGKKNGSKP